MRYLVTALTRKYEKVVDTVAGEDRGQTLVYVSSSDCIAPPPCEGQHDNCQNCDTCKRYSVVASGIGKKESAYERHQ